MDQIKFPEVTVAIHGIHDNGSVLAYATVDLGDFFAVKGVLVVQGKNGPFVSMPSRKVGNRYEDVCFPCSKEFYQKFCDAVLEAYYAELEQRGKAEDTALKNER